MSHTTKVSVFENGKPAKGRNVSLEFWEGMTKGFITDDSGTACVDHESTGHVKVYVDGNYSNTRPTGAVRGISRLAYKHCPSWRATRAVKAQQEGTCDMTQQESWFSSQNSQKIFGFCRNRNFCD